MAKAVKAIEEEKKAEEERYSGQAKTKQIRIATPGSRTPSYSSSSSSSTSSTPSSRRVPTPRRVGL